VLTAATPALGAKPAKDASRWYVRMLLLAASDESDDPKKDAAAATRFVEGGGLGVSAPVRIEGPALACFGAFGTLVALDEDATGLETACEASGTITYKVSAAQAGTRPLHVQLHPGGRVRMCDPARKLADGEADGC
jgi:type IV fimbrial biogenesis protein FimT